jgi:hypothetical protein
MSERTDEETLAEHLDHPDLDNPTCPHCREVIVARMFNQVFASPKPQE